jgi:hypothetical protein
MSEVSNRNLLDLWSVKAFYCSLGNDNCLPQCVIQFLDKITDDEEAIIIIICIVAMESSSGLKQQLNSSFT